MYLQQIAVYRESSPFTLFWKMLPAFGDSRGSGSPISSVMGDIIHLREWYGLKAYSCTENSLSSLDAGSMFPKAHQPCCWSRCRPVAPIFPCMRETTFTSDTHRYCGLPEITFQGSGSLLQQKAQKGGQWENWQPFKDSNLLVIFSIWLSALSYLLCIWIRRGKFINSLIHRINLIWHSIFHDWPQTGPVQQELFGWAEFLQCGHLPVSYRHFFALAEESFSCSQGDMQDKWERHTIPSSNSWILVQHVNIWSWFHKLSLLSFSTLLAHKS